ATLDRGGVASLITAHVAGRVESKKSVCMDIEDILPNSKSRGTLENSVWVYINCLINITADAAFGIVSAGPCDRDVIVAYRLSKKLIATQEFHPQYELVARVERNTFPLLEGSQVQLPPRLSSLFGERARARIGRSPISFRSRRHLGFVGRRFTAAGQRDVVLEQLDV